MRASHSVRFFDEQFRKQIAAGDHVLNPFEAAALPHLRGRVLDYGCGLGNLSVEAARNGCSVVAVDASEAAIEHLRQLGAREHLPLHSEVADLRHYVIAEDFDVIVCIGLLMFFDCQTAQRQLSQIKARVRRGGIAVVNVLITGTTFLDMFSADDYCLFDAEELRGAFLGWEPVSDVTQEFSAPRDTLKRFVTLTARRT